MVKDADEDADENADANSKPSFLCKEGLRNLISIASLMRLLNVLLSVARTFVLLESTE